MTESESNIYFIPSKAPGARQLIHEKYVFTINRLVGGRSYWKCVVKCCKCRIITLNDQLEKVNNEHNHPPDSIGLVRRKLKVRVKERIRQDGLLYPMPKLFKEEREKVAKEMSLTNEASFLLPSFSSVRTGMYRERKKASEVSLVSTEAGFDMDALKLEDISQDELTASYLSTRKGLLERLKDNVVIGDGGFVFSLEKRGYVKAGPWTPEATVEHPEAVRNLHREFLRAGSDVMQAFTFYASDDKLINRGNDAGKRYTGADINQAACKIAREVADEGDALVAGGISQTPTYLSNKGKDAVQAEFRKQVEVFVANNVDFLICEYFEHIEEMEWAIQVCKETNLPVAATMCIGSEGDLHDVSAGECAVRMAKAGADVVGLNCHFDPFMTLETIAIMKKALEAQGLKPYLMTQPLGFFTPDAGKQGFIDLPEFPFALEPRVCTRWDMQRYARQAYELGVRYIGGCCGFESYHIRAVSEELANERGKYPESSKKHDPWGEGLKMHTKPWVRARARKEYWQNINPSTGRPFSAALSKPDNWGITAGSEDLKQKEEATTNEELQKSFARSNK